MSDIKTLTAALLVTSSCIVAAPLFAQSQVGGQADDTRAPSNEMLRDREMLDPERASPHDSGRESHTRMADTGRPDVRSGESIEDAKEEAAGEDEE